MFDVRRFRSGGCFLFLNSAKFYGAIGLIALGAAICPSQSRAVDLVGIAQAAALDQPRINLMLSPQVNGAPGNPLMTQRYDLLDLASGEFNAIPTVNLQAYFDTGASGILLGDFTSTSMGVPRAAGVKFTDIGVAGTDEFDVSQPMYVGLAPYNPFVEVDTPTSYTQIPATMRAQLGPVRPTTNPSNDPLEQALFLLTNQEFNVVGMPAMLGKTVVIDARHTNNAATILGGDPEALDELLGGGDIEGLANFLNSLELRTYVYNPGTAFNQATADTNPGIPSVTHRVKMSYASFDQYTQVTPNGAMGPTLAHNPFVGPNPILNSPTDTTPKVKIGLGGESAEGSFLFDTGAAVSMISLDMASELNVRYTSINGVSTKGTADAALEVFDPVTQAYVSLPNQFKLTVGGIGGQTTLAGFVLDSLLLRTMEGDPLNDADPRHINFLSTPELLGAPVLVHDIVLHHTDPSQTLTLDGILGMNFMVGSVNVEISGTDIVAGGYTSGAFDWLTFDEPTGVLGLKLNSAFQTPTPGDFDGDGDVDGADFVAWQTNYPTTSGATAGQGDADGDGDVDGADFAAWQEHFSSPPGGGSSPVPEPQAWILASLAVAGLIAASKRKALVSKR